MTRRKCLLAIAGCLLGLYGGEAAYACSPAKVPVLKEQVEAADAIFVGTISGVDRSGVSLTVSKVFKGFVRHSVQVDIATSEAACGITGLKPGDTVVIYGRDKNLSSAGQGSAASVGSLFRSSILDGSHLGHSTQRERRIFRGGFLPK